MTTTTNATAEHVPPALADSQHPEGESPVSSNGPRTNQGRRLASRMLIVAALTVLGYLVVAPLVRLQLTALDDNARGYETAYVSDPKIGEVIWTTLALAVGTLLVALVLGTLLAWWTSRLPPGLRFLRALPVLPIVMPAVANIIGWAFLISPRPGYLNQLLRELPWWSHLDTGPLDVYTLPWIVIITGINLASFIYLFVSSGFANINAELVDAAQMCGSSPAGVFFRVTLPLLRPVFVYASGVALLLGAGQFTAPLLLGSNQGIDVVTTRMYQHMSQLPIDFGAASALASSLILFGIAIIVFQKFVLKDQQRFVTHTGRGFRGGATSKWSAVGILAYAVITPGLPLVALTLVSLSTFWTPNIQFSELSLVNFRRVLGESGIIDAIQTSLIASIVAVVIALPIGYVCASTMLRWKGSRSVSWTVELLVMLPLGVPAAVLGAGFLLTYKEPPLILYGTTWVIILVYVVIMLPFATRMQMSAMTAMGDAYYEASRVSGAGVLQTNLRIVVPIIRPALAGAAALMFVLLTHEFSASLLVRASTTQTMGTILFDYWSNGLYPAVAAIALIMTLVTAIGVGIAMMLGGSKVLDQL